MSRAAHRDGFGGGKASFLAAVASLLVGVFLLVTVLWWGIQAGAEFLVPHMPRSWDVNLGKMAYTDVLENPKRCKDSAMESWLNDVGPKLVEHLPPPRFEYTWAVLDEDSPNAFALPGGFIAVHKGLFALAKKPEEVAAVLGHEIIHAEQRHGMQRMVGTLGIRILGSMIFGGTDLAWLADTGFHMMLLKHSRAQEEEADLLGRALMVEAQMNPEGMAMMFERMAQEEGERRGFGAWLSSHPDTDLRAQKARQGEQPMRLKALPKLPDLTCNKAVP